MTKLLITGGSGLVGSRLLPRLVEAGFDCRALVRRDIDLAPGATAVRGDLDDPDSLPEALEGIEAIVHLAALFRTEDEEAIWRANRDGTRNLIAAAESHAPLARFIMASTSNVYDDDQVRPAKEGDPCTPSAAYPASKLVAEASLRESGMNWSILRFPFVYGDDDGHLEMMPKMAPQFGMHPARAFSVLHHRDVMTAVGLALSGAMDGRIVNIADDRPVTVYEMAELAGDSLEGSAGPLENPWSGLIDPSLAHGLGFQPTVPTIYAAARNGIL